MITLKVLFIVVTREGNSQMNCIKKDGTKQLYLVASLVNMTRNCNNVHNMICFYLKNIIDGIINNYCSNKTNFIKMILLKLFIL